LHQNRVGIVLKSRRLSREIDPEVLSKAPREIYNNRTHSNEYDGQKRRIV
jgi:hypothetical protein